jgi:hypothetical protein
MHQMQNKPITSGYAANSIRLYIVHAGAVIIKLIICVCNTYYARRYYYLGMSVWERHTTDNLSIYQSIDTVTNSYNLGSVCPRGMRC